MQAATLRGRTANRAAHLTLAAALSVGLLATITGAYGKARSRGTGTDQFAGSLPRGTIRSYPKTSTNYVRHLAGYYAWYRSPDGKYVARIYVGEAESADVAVLDPRRPAAWKHPLVDIHDVEGFIWLPRCPHTLLAAGSGIYGDSQLALWNGGRRLRQLVRLINKGDEYFELVGVSRDGRTAFYLHAWPLEGNLFYRRQRVLRRVALPEDACQEPGKGGRRVMSAPRTSPHSRQSGGVAKE